MEESARAATFKILDEYPDGYRFKGIALMQGVELRTGKIHYPDTMLRYMRDYRATTGRNIVNVDRARSIYEIQEKA
ncbi:hypothetical protein AGMMS50268_03800 [Spirochaetia bacterium]|nr:hypothetical protein AGMMS50268_03800 [Spirochaetia bacterium]